MVSLQQNYSVNGGREREKEGGLGEEIKSLCLPKSQREYVCWWECGLETESALLDLSIRLPLSGGVALGRKAQPLRFHAPSKELCFPL